MKKALEQFTRHSTTIVNRQERVEPDQPVLIACPSPPFKPSFFEGYGHDVERYFWVLDNYRKKYENDTSMSTVYMLNEPF